MKFATTETPRKWDCPSFLLLQAQKVGQSLQKWDSWQVCNIADNQHNLGKFGESQRSFAWRTMELMDGGSWNVYALFAVNKNGL